MTENLDSSFNMNFVDLTGEEDSGGSVDMNTTDHQLMQEYDHATKNNKYNSFPMRQKKSAKLKPTPRSTSSIQPPSTAPAAPPPSSASTQNCINLSLDELMLTVKLAKTRTQEATRLKNLIRNNCWPVEHPMRKYLWKCLILELLAPSSYKENNKHRSAGLIIDPSEYNQNLNTVFGKTQDIELSLPEFVYTSETSSDGSNSNHLNYYFLNVNGRQAIKRILCVYEYHYPHVTYNPGLLSICSLLLHYMQEHEVFSALCFMSSSKEHFIESKAAWDTACSVFIRLAKSYCKSSYEIILKYATDSPEAIFNDWYWWIFDCLSFDFQVKIMDCYLFEGLKVLYRVSLAIVQLFSKYLELIEEYEYVREYLFDVVKSSSIKVNKDSIKQFLESSQIESVEKLLKVSFSIRNLKRSTIKDFYTKEEVKRKNFGGGGGGAGVSNNLSPFQQPLSVSTADNQLKPLSSLENNQYSPTRIYLNDAKTSILSHNQHDQTSHLQSMSDEEVTNSTNYRQWTFSYFDIHHVQGSFLKTSSLYTLWTWIPQRLTVYSPNMLFTTQEHGTSVNTLFNVIDELEYCFIVIKTFSDEIFGAFCAGLWNERKQKKLYFGTGETFLFTLAPQKKQYKWVANKYEKLSGNQELFMRADSNKLVIGGGTKDGLSISSNLIEGTTSRCDTFENEPLCSTSQFQIAILEVVAFGQGR